MIKSIGKLSLVTILAAMVLGMPVAGFAQDTNKAAQTAPAKARAIPFNGKLAAVDKLNKTIMLEGAKKMTFEVTSETKITKDGKPATLADGVVGEMAAGQYVKNADGKMTAKSIRFGAKATTPAAPGGTTPKTQ